MGLRLLWIILHVSILLIVLSLIAAKLVCPQEQGVQVVGGLELADLADGVFGKHEFL